MSNTAPARSPAAQATATGPACPFCEAEAPELVSLFGCQLMTSHYRCRACGTYFEGLREDRLDDRPNFAGAATE